MGLVPLVQTFGWAGGDTQERKPSVMPFHMFVPPCRFNLEVLEGS